MAQLSLKLNGYAYTVGCEDGQEGHLRAMAAEVESRIARIKALGGQSGETRLLMLAALLMADELHDLTLDLAEAQTGERALPTPPPPAEPAIDHDMLVRLASRAEEIAAAMERP